MAFVAMYGDDHAGTGRFYRFKGPGSSSRWTYYESLFDMSGRNSGGNVSNHHITFRPFEIEGISVENEVYYCSFSGVKDVRRLLKTSVEKPSEVMALIHELNLNISPEVKAEVEVFFSLPTPLEEWVRLDLNDVLGGAERTYVANSFYGVYVVSCSYANGVCKAGLATQNIAERLKKYPMHCPGATVEAVFLVPVEFGGVDKLPDSEFRHLESTITGNATEWVAASAETVTAYIEEKLRFLTASS